MAWVKLEPNMPRHPKLVAAGPLGFALDVAAICYSNEYETDGFVSDSCIKSILPGLRGARAVATKLVEVGRWERDDLSGGWWIHDVDEYQPSADERAGERAKARERMRRLRASKKPKGSHGVRPNSDEVFGGTSDDVRNPDPTRPDPDRTDPPVVDQPLLTLSRMASGAERDPRVIHALNELADQDLANAMGSGDVRVPKKYRAGCLRNRLSESGPELDELAVEMPDATSEQLIKEHLERRYLA